MKTVSTCIVLAACLSCIGSNRAAGSYAKPVVELTEQLAVTAGRVPGKGVAEALEAAYRANGQAALSVARVGGLDLVEAAARHGDEVMEMAVRVPAAVPALASRAADLLPLARRYGDDILRIEAVTPGLADDAAKAFPSKADLERLIGLPPNDMRQVIAYSAHAADDTAARTLLASVDKKGSTVLERLNPKQILATGLTTAMVITAGGAAVAVISTPETALDKAAALAMPLAYSGAAAVFLFACIIGLRLWILLRPGKTHSHRS